MLIYLSGPIANCTDEECMVWRQTFHQAYPERCIDPLRQDYRDTELSKLLDPNSIVQQDLRDILECDIVVTHYTRPSAGTSMEMVYARMFKKPVILIAIDSPGIWVRAHATHIVYSINAAMKLIAKWHA